MILGLNDRQTEQVWQWSSGKPFIVNGFNNWFPGEPNNEGLENCVEMGRNSKWKDINCDRKLTYVCEHPVGKYSSSEFFFIHFRYKIAYF